MPQQKFEQIRHHHSNREADEARASAEDAEVNARLQKESERYEELRDSSDEVIRDIDFALAINTSYRLST